MNHRVYIGTSIRFQGFSNGILPGFMHWMQSKKGQMFALHNLKLVAKNICPIFSKEVILKYTILLISWHSLVMAEG